MYEFWYDYMKLKYGDNVKLCYMDTDSYKMHMKTEDFYEDIANDVEKRFDTSNYEVNRPLLTRKNKKVIGLMKDELGGKIMTKFVALRPKTYSYLTDDCEEDKKAKGTHFDRITSYPYGSSAGKVRKTELLSKVNIK